MVSANRLNVTEDKEPSSKGISPNLLSYLVAVILIAGLLTFLESSVSRKSAYGLFFLILVGMLIARQEIIIRIAGLVNRLNPNG